MERDIRQFIKEVLSIPLTHPTEYVQETINLKYMVSFLVFPLKYQMVNNQKKQIGNHKRQKIS